MNFSKFNNQTGIKLEHLPKRVQVNILYLVSLLPPTADAMRLMDVFDKGNEFIAKYREVAPEMYLNKPFFDSNKSNDELFITHLQPRGYMTTLTGTGSEHGVNTNDADGDGVGKMGVTPKGLTCITDRTGQYKLHGTKALTALAELIAVLPSDEKDLIAFTISNYYNQAPETVVNILYLLGYPLVVMNNITALTFSAFKKFVGDKKTGTRFKTIASIYGVAVADIEGLCNGLDCDRLDGGLYGDGADSGLDGDEGSFADYWKIIKLIAKWGFFTGIVSTFFVLSVYMVMMFFRG